jgi:phosphoribosylformylglycinamidine cyclo-ligase
MSALPPRAPAIFDFLVKAGPIEMREAYATFNMGIGFAVYVDPNDAKTCQAIASDCGYEAWLAGSVQKQGQRKAVEIPSLGITFESDTLQLRS